MIKVREALSAMWYVEPRHIMYVHACLSHTKNLNSVIVVIVYLSYLFYEYHKSNHCFVFVYQTFYYKVRIFSCWRTYVTMTYIYFNSLQCRIRWTVVSLSLYHIHRLIEICVLYWTYLVFNGKRWDRAFINKWPF